MERAYIFRDVRGKKGNGRTMKPSEDKKGKKP